MKVKKILQKGGIALAVLLVGIQAVPYGRNHTNPPKGMEPQWNSPQTRALAERACYDCHSNETEWPWYSSIAPVSWLVQRDVDDGRRHLNFSQWQNPQRHAKDSAEEVEKGEMPPWFFLPTHPEARLSAAEKTQLIDGLKATFGASEGHDEEEH